MPLANCLTHDRAEYIPCCGPCLVLGIPFGIWALVLLNDSRIRPHFQ